MNTQYTSTEINQKRQLLQNYHPAQEALTVLEQHQGQLDEAFDQLWSQTHESNIATFDKGKKRSFWQVTLEVLRTEICGDEGFRSKINEFNKNPGSAPLLTGLIVYLVEITTIAISPAIATIIVLYIIKVGLNIFCEYTTPIEDDA
ncbi:MAG: hypothetical protein WBA77_07835 [Microcoleaceae cyanobacterium]